MYTGYNALTPEQILAISKLNELYNICVKYIDIDNCPKNIHIVLDDYLKCLKIVKDPIFIESLKSIEFLHPKLKEFIQYYFQDY